MEEKLREIFKQHYAPILNNEDVLFPQIIQAFKDEGWRELPVKVDEKDNLWLSLDKPMTGQEWYDRFMALLEEPTKLGTAKSPTQVGVIFENWIRDCAKKAAGI